MRTKLDGKKVAILVTNGFEEVELTSPKKALEDAGAETEILSPVEKRVRSWAETDWGSKFKVDVPLNEANASDYPDKLRLEPKAIEFIREFFEAGKPVAAIWAPGP
jgi:protease I